TRQTSQPVTITAAPTRRVAPALRSSDAGRGAGETRQTSQPVTITAAPTRRVAPALRSSDAGRGAGETRQTNRPVTITAPPNTAGCTRPTQLRRGAWGG